MQKKLIEGDDIKFEDVLSEIEIQKNETNRLNDEQLRLKLNWKIDLKS